MSQPPQPPAQEPRPAPATPPQGIPPYGAPPSGAAPATGPQPWSQPASQPWSQPASQPWSQSWSPNWPAPGYPGTPVVEPRSTGKAPLVLALVAFGALLAGGVAGFLIATVVFMAGTGGMGMGVGMEEGPLGPVEEFPAVPPGDLGPDPVLDEYADACFAGEFQACDDLLYESPPLSEYEEYGGSCGGRVKAYSLMSCTELE